MRNPVSFTHHWPYYLHLQITLFWSKSTILSLCCVSHLQLLWHAVLWFWFGMSRTFILYLKQRVVENKLIAVKSTPSPSYLPTFMSCYFSHVLVNCMHAIHFPQGTLSFFSSERSDWGSALYGRYISVQEHSTERVGPVSVIYSKSKSPAGACCQSHWHHLRVTSKHWVGKNRDSCLQIQPPVLFFVGDGN